MLILAFIVSSVHFIYMLNTHTLHKRSVFYTLKHFKDSNSRFKRGNSTLPNLYSSNRTEIGSRQYIGYSKTEQFDENAFLSDLAQQYWSNINSYEDPSAAVQLFNDTFLSLLDKHVPLKKKRVKQCQQPGWMNQEILNSIRTRDKFHNEKDMNNYKKWRNKVISLMFKSKQDFFNDAINSNVKNPKKTMGR